MHRLKGDGRERGVTGGGEGQILVTSFLFPWTKRPFHKRSILNGKKWLIYEQVL